MNVEVECQAGYGGELTPRRLRFGGQSVDVAELLDQWLAPDHRYFKLKGANGAIYILRHDVLQNRWELTMFTSEKMQRVGR